MNIFSTHFIEDGMKTGIKILVCARIGSGHKRGDNALHAEHVLTPSNFEKLREDRRSPVWL